MWRDASAAFIQRRRDENGSSGLVLSSLRCLQNYIPPHSLTLSCPVCRQTSILPEKGVAALQNNFFITNLMDVLQRTPGRCSQEAAALNSVASVAVGQLLSCPNHGGNVRATASLLRPCRSRISLWLV